MPFVLLHRGSLFDAGDRHESETSILWDLENLTERNVRYLEKNPGTVKLYDSDVVYALPDQLTNKIDPRYKDAIRRTLMQARADSETVEIVMAFLDGIEIFRDIPAVLAKKKVDCDNLAAFRAAELRRAGRKATPYITWRETNGGTTYHALVRHGDGTSEDPSLILGMGGAKKARERAEEIRKNHERYDDMVEAAKLLYQGGAPLGPMATQIEMMGYLPKDGRW